MGRSGALWLASVVLLLPAQQTAAQEFGTPAYWDGFYLAVLGGAGTGVESNGGDFTRLGVAAGTGTMLNGAFYFGAEAMLAAESFEGSDPYLWLQADGRLGAQVTETMLLFTSAGVGYDADADELALTGGVGVELALSGSVALRAQYSLQHYPSGLGTFHEGLAGVVLKFE